MLVMEETQVVLDIVTSAGQPVVLHLYERKEGKNVSELAAFILDILFSIIINIGHF